MLVPAPLKTSESDSAASGSVGTAVSEVAPLSSVSLRGCRCHCQALSGLADFPGRVRLRSRAPRAWSWTLVTRNAEHTAIRTAPPTQAAHGVNLRVPDFLWLPRFHFSRLAADAIDSDDHASGAHRLFGNTSSLRSMSADRHSAPSLLCCARQSVKAPNAWLLVRAQRPAWTIDVSPARFIACIPASFPSVWRGDLVRKTRS